jgi:hypothetical protein
VAVRGSTFAGKQAGSLLHNGQERGGEGKLESPLRDHPRAIVEQASSLLRSVGVFVEQATRQLDSDNASVAEQASSLLAARVGRTVR